VCTGTPDAIIADMRGGSPSERQGRMIDNDKARSMGNKREDKF
jgi:hypothetical protein